jgi:hypothetical protein
MDSVKIKHAAMRSTETKILKWPKRDVGHGGVGTDAAVLSNSPLGVRREHFSTINPHFSVGTFTKISAAQPRARCFSTHLTDHSPIAAP